MATFRPANGAALSSVIACITWKPLPTANANIEKVELGTVGGDFQKRLTALLERAGLPLIHRDAPGLFDRIVRALQLDKKFRDGKNLFVLPTGIGSWAPRENVDWSLVHDCVRGVLA